MSRPRPNRLVDRRPLPPTAYVTAEARDPMRCKGCMQRLEACSCDDTPRKLGRFEKETDDGIAREELNFDA